MDITAQVDPLQQAGHYTQEEVGAAMQRITCSTDIKVAVMNADFVIEVRICSAQARGGIYQRCLGVYQQCLGGLAGVWPGSGRSALRSMPSRFLRSRRPSLSSYYCGACGLMRCLPPPRCA